MPDRLTETNLDWHQNSFNKPDPSHGKQPFSLNTPFISTTAGTVERDTVNRTNTLTPAWKTALFFATDRWKTDGWLFDCHLFLIGKRAVRVEAFSEELRELNIYTAFSPFYVEGEITAKLVIPTAQIERADFWSLSDAKNAVASGILPTASRTRRQQILCEAGKTTITFAASWLDSHCHGLKRYATQRFPQGTRARSGVD